MAAALSWRTKLSISMAKSMTNYSRRPDGTVNRILTGAFGLLAKVRAQDSKGVKVSDVTIDYRRETWFRLFVPTEVSDQVQLPVIVFIHGGAFSFFSPDHKGYDALCREMALKCSAIVVSVHYRLTPECRYPAQYHDVFDTLKFLERRKIDGFPANADLSRCFLVGDSAGANIGHHVARRYAEAESEFSKLKVIGLVVIQGFFGGEERTESEIKFKDTGLVTTEAADWHWKVFLPEGENRDHEACNIFGPKSSDISDLKNFPDVLVFVGGLDALQEWQTRYYEGLKKAGKKAELVEYEDTIHGFYAFPEIPVNSQFHSKLAEFLRER